MAWHTMTDAQIAGLISTRIDRTGSDIVGDVMDNDGHREVVA